MLDNDSIDRGIGRLVDLCYVAGKDTHLTAELLEMTLEAIKSPPEKEPELRKCSHKYLSGDGYEKCVYCGYKNPANPTSSVYGKIKIDPSLPEGHFYLINEKYCKIIPNPEEKLYGRSLAERLKPLQDKENLERDREMTEIRIKACTTETGGCVVCGRPIFGTDPIRAVWEKQKGTMAEFPYSKGTCGRDLWNAIKAYCEEGE